MSYENENQKACDSSRDSASLGNATKGYQQGRPSSATPSVLDTFRCELRYKARRLRLDIKQLQQKASTLEELANSLD